MGFIEWSNWSDLTGKGFFHGKNTLKIGPRNYCFWIQFGTDFIDPKYKNKYNNGVKIEDKDYWKVWKVDSWAIRFCFFWKNKGKV